jgi:hypothetical protein
MVFRDQCADTQRRGRSGDFTFMPENQPPFGNANRTPFSISLA